jgi:hypothetical protein
MKNFEDRLAGYRPSAPPPDLRSRILLAAEESHPSSVREWLPALAAAALIVMLSALSYRLHADIDSRLAVPDDLRPVEQWLPEQIEGLR